MLSGPPSNALLHLLTDHESTIRLSTVKALAKLKIKRGVPGIMDCLQGDRDPAVRVAALEALASLESEGIGEAIEQSLADQERRVRIDGLDLLPAMNIPAPQTVYLLSLFRSEYVRVGNKVFGQ